MISDDPWLVRCLLEPFIHSTEKCGNKTGTTTASIGNYRLNPAFLAIGIPVVVFTYIPGQHGSDSMDTLCPSIHIIKRDKKPPQKSKTIMLLLVG